MGFEIVSKSVLHICRMPIQELAGFADHYYLSESKTLQNSVGWGPNGLELRGFVKVTPGEIERIERFISVAKYSIAINNCEHFAYYILHGINFSSQQHNLWQGLGSKIISRLQPVQNIGANQNSIMRQQIAEVLNENLRQAKIQRAEQERMKFWKERGIDIQK